MGRLAILWAGCPGTKQAVQTHEIDKDKDHIRGSEAESPVRVAPVRRREEE
jgi:hypothetical protein